jgi:hypothetical protein
MFLVAITRLDAPLEDEAVPLAKDLGVTPYEARMLLAPGMPAVVLTTPDRDRALAVLSGLRARGRDAVACDSSAIVGAERMIAMREPTFDDLGVRATPNDGEVLPYSDVLAMLRASHRVSTETKTEVKEKKLRPGMMIATGGLVNSKTVTKEVVTTTEAREQVLYVFRKAGGTPFILHETGTRYAGLGADVGRSSFENFGKIIALLRTRAPGAAYDERLVSRKVADAKGGTVASVDQLAHVLALALAKGIAGR